MPCISGAYNPAVGPLTQIVIVAPTPEMLSGIASPSAISVNSPVQSPRFYTALIDTGATLTCISPKVVHEVGLQPTGKSMMTGATGSSAVNTYQFGVGFMTNQVQMPTGQLTGTLEVRIVDGMEFAVQGAVFDILLGRDIICAGTFSLSFDGHFLLSW